MGKGVKFNVRCDIIFRTGAVAEKFFYGPNAGEVACDFTFIFGIIL